MSKTFEQILKEKIVVFDGAMGTNIQTQNLTADDFGGDHLNGCNEYLLVSKPSAIEKVHSDFLSVGVDVIETNTFGSASIVLAEYNLQDRAYEISKLGASLAKKVVQDFQPKPSQDLLPARLVPQRNFRHLVTLHFLKWKDRITNKLPV